jgi:uncharacterized lipoprotein
MKLRLITTVLISAFIFSVAGCATSPSRGISRADHETSDGTRRAVKAPNSPDSTHGSVSQTAAPPAAETRLIAHQEEVPPPHAHSDLMVPPVVCAE